jgi:hypothetical protein
MFKITGKLPDDPFYEDINPYLRMLLFECWLYEKEFESERMTNQAILIGSFYNPEAAQKMIKSENPDFESSDEDFEKTSQMIHEQAVQDEKTSKKKRRKVVG